MLQTGESGVFFSEKRVCEYKTIQALDVSEKSNNAGAYCSH